MNDLGIAIMDHFEDFAGVHCPKLAASRHNSGSMLQLRAGKSYVLLYWDDAVTITCAGMSAPPRVETGLEVEMNVPGSIEQLETFLREFHDQLP